jgi:uncharacterized membrane protein YhaH (DUF805 family)
MNWYLEVMKKYVTFSGRARRKEYWMFVLVNGIIAFVLATIQSATVDSNGQSPLVILTSLYSLAVFLPSLAVSVRRLHDTGHSGWWYLIVLVPLIGAIVLLVWFVSDSQPGENQYGPNPKDVSAKFTNALPA